MVTSVQSMPDEVNEIIKRVDVYLGETSVRKVRLVFLNICAF